MSELDLTEAEAKSTYDEIQEYVKEQTGLHVTHLNIAQIKRKRGIIERANYNLPKSEKSRQLVTVQGLLESGDTASAVKLTKELTKSIAVEMSEVNTGHRTQDS